MRVLIAITVFVTFLTPQNRYDLVVAKDGTGNVRTVQEAVDRAPSSSERPFIIFIKNGIYNEKVFISKSNLVLAGNHQDSVKIVFAELRKFRNASMFGNDWGAAVVNIDSTCSDLTFINLTVYNNYGALSGDHDHQFAMWGRGTRIILYQCRIVSDGGDALSLWNAERGMYYHAQCSFEGWVDYVCPRGWCFITDSRFFGHNLTASLWHDGSSDKEQKFVIVNSTFDGVKNFPLGRHHRDGQFFLVNNRFSENLADSSIHYPSYSPNARPWKWGRRHYYAKNRRDGGNFSWFADNLHTYQDGKLRADDITARWTFGGAWDPERELQSITRRMKE